MATEATQETENLPWREKLLKLWANVRLAHEGMMLDKIQQQQKRVFQVADLSLTGKAGSESINANGDEDMGVSIGNEIHYHYEGGDATNTATQPSSSGTSTLGKVATAAALIAGGAGGSYLVNEYVLNNDTPAAIDTDTKTDVVFPE